MAMVYVALGDTARGLAMLEQAESDTAFTLAWLPSFPMYDGIRCTHSIDAWSNVSASYRADT